MKKSYKKPMMEIVPFALNESVASGCKIDVYQNMSDASCEYTEKWNDVLDTLQVDASAFNFAEDGCTSYIKGYCYFTSSETVFSS